MRSSPITSSFTQLDSPASRPSRAVRIASCRGVAARGVGQDEHATGRCSPSATSPLLSLRSTRRTATVTISAPEAAWHCAHHLVRRVLAGADEQAGRERAISDGQGVSHGWRRAGRKQEPQHYRGRAPATVPLETRTLPVLAGGRVHRAAHTRDRTYIMTSGGSHEQCERHHEGHPGIRRPRWPSVTHITDSQQDSCQDDPGPGSTKSHDLGGGHNAPQGGEGEEPASLVDVLGVERTPAAQKAGAGTGRRWRPIGGPACRVQWPPTLARCAETHAPTQ